MQHSKFVHLHLHTQYSLLDGAIRHDDLFKLSREYRMPAVAMTDHGNLFGAVEFYEKAIKNGIKPIIGCEVYVAPGSRFKKRSKADNGNSPLFYHLILLIKNMKGYQNLCRLVTSGYLEGYYYKPRIDKDLLKENNEGLIALSACLKGEIPYLLNKGESQRALDIAAEYKAIFPDRRFFLELQDNGIKEQKVANMGLIDIGRKLDIPLVATNDCHYLRKEDAKAHDILLCIQTGKTVSVEERLRFSTDEFYFKSPEEMKKSFEYCPDAIKNTIEIAERCNLELELGLPRLPEFPLPKDEDVDKYLEQKARKGLKDRFEGSSTGDIDSHHYIERLERELKVIEKMGFSGYFLIVADLIANARKRGIPVGPGRGSAAGSLVAYSLGITNIDPIKYNLLFERFLNADRISLPDIDIDFCYEGRDDVINYVSEKYGRDNVTQIITFGQMKARAVIRDVGRVLDMPYAEVDKIAKMIPPVQNITIDQAVEQESQLKELIEGDGRVRDLVEIARSLEGLMRHASTHAAGIVISSRPLIESLPLYKGQKDSVITTQYAMKDVEKIGLVKFDFLGLKTLTVIDRTVRLLRQNRGKELNIDNLPLDDKETYRLIGRGETNGVFQLESAGMKELLHKLRPEKFEDLMAVLAIHRPGPLQSGMVDDFIKRRHGRVPVNYEIPELKEILDSTCGVIIYQEQVMEIARVLASFTPGDADALRKAMGKKLPDEMLEQRAKFLAGAKKNKVPQKSAERIFDIMAKFAGYGFNKSHSACYAMIAYQTAYLKAHYPVEFMAALLTSDMGDTDKIIRYIGECRDMGIEVLPPDINESDRTFTVVGSRIRFGLAAVKNVGNSAIDAILKAKREGRFDSFIDFIQRVGSMKVNKKVVESLIKCGAFDFSGARRAQLMASMDRAMEIVHGMQKDRENGQTTIFDAMNDVRMPQALVLSDVEEWSESEKLMYERDVIGFYISGHPMLRYLDEFKIYSTVDTETVKERNNGEEISIGGVVTGKKEIKTRKGERMSFVTIEDLKGNIEVVVFSDVFRKVFEHLNSTTPIIIEGKIDKGEQHIKIIASNIYPLEDAGKKCKKRTHIILNASDIGNAELRELKRVISSCSGSVQVFLHLKREDGRETIIELPENLRIVPSAKFFNSIRDVSRAIDVRLY